MRDRQNAKRDLLEKEMKPEVIGGGGCMHAKRDLLEKEMRPAKQSRRM
jgi:hypothetical protein